ncbi:MAG: ABC transporter permease [Archaeoglobaceae archaeon]
MEATEVVVPMYFELAKRNLLRTKVRSSLAIIGIIIGVMAIASIGIFGESLRASVTQNFEDLATQVQIFPATSEGYSEIDQDVVDRIENSPRVETFIPIKSSMDFIEYKSDRVYSTVYGVKGDNIDDLFQAEDEGGDVNLKRGGCVVGGSIADNFGLREGSKITVAGKDFRVNTILAEEARYDINPNNVVFLQTEDFDNTFDEGYSQIIVRVETIEDVDEFIDYVEERINLRDEKVQVFELRQILDSINAAFSQITSFLMAIAGISLLVAGVSILNIMLMSTIERTKEIGVMRAIGAYRQVILRIFMLEALILGVAGGVIGGMLSILGGFAINMIVLNSVEYLFVSTTAIYIFEGVIFGILVAVLSGIYPAWKASNLEPIEALRYE